MLLMNILRGSHEKYFAHNTNVIRFSLESNFRIMSVWAKQFINTVEHSRETEIWFDITAVRSILRQIKSKGSEKPFNIVGACYTPCSI